MVRTNSLPRSDEAGPVRRVRKANRSRSLKRELESDEFSKRLVESRNNNRGTN